MINLIWIQKISYKEVAQFRDATWQNATRLYEALYIGNPNLSIFTSRTKKATKHLEQYDGSKHPGTKPM
jgi:hypothetical protein